MSSHRLAQWTLDSLEVTGYSVAGEETVVALPTLDVCFDVGKAPDQVLAINHVLLTHGHMDHAAGIAYYCSQRDFREMTPGTILLPECLAGDVENLLNCWGRIDGSRPPAKIVPMKAGQEYEIRRNLFAVAFDTNHCRGSLGFTILDRRQKLKEEYLELPGHEIAKLRKGGCEITYTLEVPLVTYLGDTMSGPFEQLEYVRNSRILIAECTFFHQDHRDRANAGRHYHFDDLAGILEKMNNQHILLTHMSRRTDFRLAKRLIREKLSPEVSAKIHFLMEHPRRKTSSETASGQENP